MSKKVALVIYSCKFKDKVEKVNLEKEIRDVIMSLGKNAICVEFYNVSEPDHLESKFHNLLKKRYPDSTLFYDCQKETMEEMIKTIEERIADEVTFFFKNHRLSGLIIKKAKEVSSVKEFASEFMAN